MVTLWLHGIVVDSGYPGAAGRFWARALGWPITYEGPDEVVIAAPEGRPPSLVLVRVPEPKTARNRLHLDLRSGSLAEQAETVERVRGLGARPVDVGQGDVPWTVLGDPESNEFCVLEPRPQYAGTGPIASVVVEAGNPHALGAFWSAVLDWPVIVDDRRLVALRSPDGWAPYLEFVPATTPRRGKNRLHLDVAPHADGDQAAEVERVRKLGARRAVIGQGATDWVVMADPEGNEFCILSPKEWASRA